MTIPGEGHSQDPTMLIDPAPFESIARAHSDLRTWQEGEVPDGVTLLTSRNPIKFEDHRGFFTERTEEQLPYPLRGLLELLDANDPKSPLVIVGAYKSPTLFMAAMPRELADFTFTKRGFDRASIKEQFEEEGLWVALGATTNSLAIDPDRPQHQTGVNLRASKVLDTVDVSRYGGSDITPAATTEIAVDIQLQQRLDDSQKRVEIARNLLAGVAEILSR